MMHSLHAPAAAMLPDDGIFVAPAIVRGEVIETDLVEFGGRGRDAFPFLAPDPASFVDRLGLTRPGDLADLRALSFDRILDFLEELGKRLRLEDNPHMQRALAGSYRTAPTTPPLLDHNYRTLHRAFQRDVMREMAETTVGVRYLEGWVPTTLIDGRTAHIRAFGSRQLHIVAGNAPIISAMTIIRSAITRSDAIIKSPSNDPFTALAIARTMCDFAPDHPVTRHISVAYWKGGDTAFENAFYQPHNIEKIVAWGGLASVKHVTRYIQPGLELISLDPKRSISIIGEALFESDATLDEAAHRLALDFGSTNQVGCVTSRIAYVESGTDDDGLERLRDFAARVHRALLALPPHMSTAPKEVDRDLKANLEAARLEEDWYHVVGGEDEEGAVIVSLLPEPVAFAESLNNRIINLVPIDAAGEALRFCDAYTQTIGIYPEDLKAELRDELPLYGAQRIVSLGYAVTTNMSLPQDAIEPLRRACKWIVDEESDPAMNSPVWED